MRVLLRNTQTGLFFAGTDQWTDDQSQAMDFEATDRALHHELNRLLGSTNNAGAGAAPQKRRTMSRSSIAKIRAAAKARWAKIKGKTGKAKPGSKPGRRKMSAAGKARLSALAKARWKK